MVLPGESAAIASRPVTWFWGESPAPAYMLLHDWDDRQQMNPWLFILLSLFFLLLVFFF